MKYKSSLNYFFKSFGKFMQKTFQYQNQFKIDNLNINDTLNAYELPYYINCLFINFEVNFLSNGLITIQIITLNLN